jgi:alpha-beta hydrolase superfamily lysophospholipase
MSRPDVASLREIFNGPHELVHASDGKTPFVRRWDARKRDSQVSVLIFHGITAYSSPYGPMIAEQLSNAGFNVFGMDLRGHGLSDGSRGDYPSEERLIKDLTETVALVKAKSKKLVVLGHSLGALSAIIAVNNRSQDIDGLILLSAARKVRTGVYPRPKAAEVLKLLFAVSILRGRPLIEYRRERMLGLDDPLFNFKYSARFYSVMYGVGALAVSKMFRLGIVDSPNLRFKEKLRIPLLIGVGDQDELFAVEYAKEFFEEIDCDDKQFLVIPGARHAVFPRDGWGQLLTWLQKEF